MSSIQAFVLFAIFMLGACSASIGIDVGEPDWNDLKVTWGPSALNSNFFKAMPRTTTDALTKNFTKVSDCDVTAKWRGARYVKDNDDAVVLLYDVNGYIAGIQTSVSSGRRSGYPKPNVRPPFVKDGNNFILSVYFVDPATICTTGRSADDFAIDGTGTDLYFQNGTDPETDLAHIPHKQSDVTATSWTKGACVPTMGVHYWYDITADMNCDDFFPLFILYNGGKLNAFGFTLATSMASTHYEHPPQINVPGNKVLECIASYDGYDSMHVFLTSNAALNTC